MRLLKTALKFSLLLPLAATSQYLQVNDSYSAQYLVENVLIDSPCANVSNFSVSGDTFSGGQNSYGYFTANGSDFPFPNGVILSTARAKRSEGPNVNLIDEGSVNWGGDADLEQALGITGTINATSLEFDFTPLTSQISFDYIFASEEYHDDAQCQYSDGFAFLLRPADGSQPYQNLALIPNTNIPVLVTNVHPAVPGVCPAANQEFFGQYNGVNSAINYNGQTAVLTARANVVPGVTYHIKLVIADHHNYRYDSAIFLSGGSFSVGTDIGPDRLIATNNPVCENDVYVLDATEPSATAYQWYKGNTIIPGSTGPQFTVTEPGTYRAEVTLGSTGCVAWGEAVVEYSMLPQVNTITLTQCDDNGDGITVFDLTRANNTITTLPANTYTVFFYPTPADALAETNQITQPTTYTSAAGSVFAKVTNMFGCASVAEVNLVIASNTIAPIPPIAKCGDDNDGIASFNFSTDVTPLVLPGLPAGVLIQYYASASDALSGSSPLPAIYSNTVPFSQTIYAKIINGPDCYGIIPVTLVVNAFNSPGFDDETVFLCSGSSVTLHAPAGYSGYLWSTGSISNLIQVSSEGSYSVTVTNSSGCALTKNFTVMLTSSAVFEPATVRDFSGSNTVTLNYSGLGNYQFSLGGEYYQDSPVFTDIAPGIYQAYIRDLNGCPISGPQEIVVMDYPKFFTPNGDGANDVWYIKNLHRIGNSALNIFDRYGKLLYSFRDGNDYWTGRKDGADLPSTDYWFVLEMENGRIVRGHFSLKR